jgi:hypothetical protein
VRDVEQTNVHVVHSTMRTAVEMARLSCIAGQ